MTAHPAQIENYTAADGRRLALRHFLPAGEPRGTVVLLHGIISHSGWYNASARYLAEQGFDVFSLDRRGSGLNMAARGDVDDYRTWINDVVSFCEPRRERGPVVLLGISWGGKLAPVVARRRPDLLAGFGMLCPGIYARQQPGLAKRGAVAASGKLGFEERRVTIPLEDPALFTNSPKYRKFVRDDPLTLREITMRFAHQDHQLTKLARRSHAFIHTPALLVLAGQDQMVRNQRTRRYLTQLASQDKTLLEYDSAAHTLEFEPDPSGFFRDLANWTARVCDPRAM